MLCPQSQSTQSVPRSVCRPAPPPASSARTAAPSNVCRRRCAYLFVHFIVTPTSVIRSSNVVLAGGSVFPRRFCRLCLLSLSLARVLRKSRLLSQFEAFLLSLSFVAFLVYLFLAVLTSWHTSCPLSFHLPQRLARPPWPHHTLSIFACFHVPLQSTAWSVWVLKAELTSPTTISILNEHSQFHSGSAQSVRSSRALLTSGASIWSLRCPIPSRSIALAEPYFQLPPGPYSTRLPW